MFEASISLHDLGAPFAMANGALYFGNSFVRPLAHRMVRWELVSSATRTVVIAVERFADDFVPSGNHHHAIDAELDAKLEALGDYLLDFAILTLDHTALEIRYRASPVVFVPAYIYHDRGLVRVDWDYARLLRSVSIEPDVDIVLGQIAGRAVYDVRTAVDGLFRVSAETTLVLKASGVKVIYSPSIEYEGLRTIGQDVDVEDAFFDALTAIVAARPVTSSQTAVEVSGGMDSALTALATGSAAGGRLLSIGAIFAGDMGRAQQERRRLIVEQGGFDDLAIPAERFAPFAPGTVRRMPGLVLPDDENYPELFEVLFTALRSAGIDTLVSGFGGDELYCIYEGEEDAKVVCTDPSPFLSPAGSRQAMALASRHPTSWLQPSCWQSAAARSRRVLRYGLWPVYPYINPPLARFVSCLPYEHRHGRTLLKRVLTRQLNSPAYETDYKKETFGAVARRGIDENKNYLIQIVQSSSLRRLKQIDTNAILRTLRQPIHKLDKPTFEGLFRALKVFSFFSSEHGV